VPALVLQSFPDSSSFNKLTGTFDNYYAFDDDKKRSPYARYSQDKEDLKKNCRRVKFHRFNPLNCNTMHELDFQSVTGRGDTRHVGTGAYRHVYLTKVGIEDVIVKKFGLNSAFDSANFEYMRMDTLVAERLSSRDEIVDIYTSCGLANVNGKFCSSYQTFFCPAADRLRDAAQNR
jgi:hypothetical protein